MRPLRLVVLAFMAGSTLMPAHAASIPSNSEPEAAAPPLAGPPVSADPGALPPGKPLASAEAWNALVGNTIAGQTPDGPYKEFFQPDGTVIHVDRDGKDVGHWTLKQSSICFTYPDDDGEDCRTLQVEGSHGAFVDRDGSTYRFDILTGNPEHL